MNNGFHITDLFDFTFTKFITTSVVRILYGLAMIVAFLSSVVMIISGFSNGFWQGLGMSVISLLAFILCVAVARVWLEVLIVIFRIAENTQKLADKAESGLPNSSTIPSAD